MKGYYNDEQATASVLSEDGWLATGDLGLLDDNGNLHVHGRVKNIITLEDGTTLSPEMVEQMMNTCHWVIESLIVENSGHLEGWVYPDYELIDEQTAGQTQSARHEYIETLIRELHSDMNNRLPDNQQIKEIFERREPFMKTVTHKIKRYLYDGHKMVVNDA